MISIFDMTLLVCAVLASGSFAYLWVDYEPRRETPEQPLDPDICYLFDHSVLQHASDAAQDLHPLQPGLHEWSDLRDLIVDRFPDFPQSPVVIASGELCLAAQDRGMPARIKVSWRDGLSWVRFLTHVEKVAVIEKNERLVLQRLTHGMTVPVWHSDTNGNLLWWNAAYEDLYAEIYPNEPPNARPLFDNDAIRHRQRASLRKADTDKKDWYEVSQVDENDVLCHQAICINPLVHAEEAQRNFVQTLTKTFAHLSIGLAIFDRRKQLVLFNPALVDMTGLRAEFLSARPTVETFFDNLRESRRMPEPKSYANWRNRITEMISAASEGRFEETWSLDSGQTYRVKGRPHPDGATAFLIEDISAEVSLTRNFRAELEQGQAMLDTLDDAIAVFSGSGILTFSNSAYHDLWKVDPGSSFADVSIHDAIQDWKRKSAPNIMWQEIENFARNLGYRKPWDMPLYLPDGVQLTCVISPIVAGATLIRFQRSRKPEAIIPAPGPHSFTIDR